MAIPPAVGAALVTGGASLIGGLLGKSQDKSNFWNQASLDESRRQFKVIQQETIQNRVRDAKKAGLHPLFALGGQASSGTPFIPGQSPSGSALGEGIKQAGAAAGRAIGGGALQAAQIKLLEAQAYSSTASGMEADSRRKRAELSALNVRPGNFQGMPPTRTLPGQPNPLLSPGTPSAWRDLPITEEGKQQLAQFIRTVGPEGARLMMNPAIGDEISQVYNAVDPWVQTVEGYMSSRRFKPNAGALRRAARYAKHRKAYRKHAERIRGLQERFQ